MEFLQGKESAEKALADVEDAYVAKATEEGFYNPSLKSILESGSI
ncbi:MAG: hypothetical protein CM15mP70_03490 [Pelagibacteraceae bacterium]|nr:MAG: hypothetical protein CM15mP70_03490 [Pelagibacteraceae bacterium]